eukprot:TRINITY_DN211_c0_g1_i1.p1 TRINITY_DN211_c0_g1~~TRINITY_DN211_c0_g1_i1.p1  ORF type:complete len:419 (-),score=151.69 TRINITY_DN211_c0_g1_i1:93-1349(-)
MEEVTADEAIDIQPSLASTTPSTSDPEESAPPPSTSASADAVGEDGEDGESDTLTQQQQPKKDVYAKVTDPTVVGDNLRGFVTYAVVTKKADGTDLISVRRYSAFDWLRKQLRQQYPSLLAPPLPEKTVLDRFAPEFMEYRRKELQRFLKRVLGHPVLSETKVVTMFLTAPEDQLSILQKEAAPKKEKRSLMSYFSSAADKLTSLAGNAPVEVTKWFDSEKGYMNDLSQHLFAAETRVSTSNLKMRELVTALSEFSHAANLLGTAENHHDDAFGGLWRKLSEILSEMSIISFEVAKNSELGFEDALKDYRRLTEAAQELLEYRDVVLLDWQNAQLDTKEKSKKGTSQQIEECRKKEAQTKAEYKRVSKKVKMELKAFQDTKKEELTGALRLLTKANMDYHLQMASLWKGLLKKMEMDE